MTKVLLLANTDWYLYNFRLSFASFLKQNNYEVVFVCPPGAYAGKLQELGFRWVEWHVHRKFAWPWTELASLNRLLSIFRKEQPEIIHSHTLKAVLFACVAGLFYPKTSFINSIAGRGHLYTSKNPLNRFIGSILGSLFRFIDKRLKPKWLFENQNDFNYFIERGLIAPNHAHLIEGVGVDIDTYLAIPEPEGVPKVLYAGRFLWSKGLGDLVEAVGRIKSQGRNVELTLVGQPDKGNPDSIDRRTLEEWTHHGLVRWVGWQEETAIWYQQTNVFAFPTKYGEGVPTVLLEAAASGRAIVTTNHPGCTVVVTHGVNGLLVPPNDVEAITIAILKLIDDHSLRREMGIQGRKLVEARFSKGTINERTLAVYSLVPD